MKNPLVLIIMAVLLAKDSITVSSSAFVSYGNIPILYTCQGQNINPPITIGSLPSGTKSLVLIMDDPDAPKGTFVHWVLYDIPPTNLIEENSIPGTQGRNGAGKNEYTGPCPPTGKHHYHFKIYALDKMLNADAGLEKSEVEELMKDHILGTGELVALYKKGM